MGVKGAILGDIIGSKYEFSGCNNPETCKLITNRNFFTDDTILSLAVKWAIDNCIDFSTAYYVFAQHYKNYRLAGWGNNFKKWVYDGGVGHRQSLGNGSAMRVGYISDYSRDIDFVTSVATDSAKPTHYTNEGIRGAVTTAVCSAMAKRGNSKDEILDYAMTQYGTAVDKTLTDFKKDYRWSCKCEKSVPLAIRCFYESTNFESCMRNVLSIYCDSDTICAIAGNIAESYYGVTIENEDEILRDFLDEPLYHILTT